MILNRLLTSTWKQYPVGRKSEKLINERSTPTLVQTDEPIPPGNLFFHDMKLGLV